jgi:GNAT superfamily N-acetyltransferase
MEISIRPYTPTDLEPVAAIWHDGWDSTGMNALIAPENLTSLDALRERLPLDIAGGWAIYVACSEGRAVGFLAISAAYVHQLFVARAEQSRGIGKRLLDFAKSELKSGFALTTPTASPAVRFYEREGLKAEGTSIHPRHGLERVHMRWTPT